MRSITLIYCLFILSGCAHTAAPIEPARTALPDKFLGLWYYHPGASSNISIIIEKNGGILELLPIGPNIIDYKLIYIENRYSYYIMTRYPLNGETQYAYGHFTLKYADNLDTPNRFEWWSWCYTSDPKEWYWTDAQYRRRILKPTAKECDIRELKASEFFYRN